MALKDVRVRFAGVEVAKPHEGNLTIYYIPDQTQTLIAGEKYKVIIEGLSFAHKDTAKHFEVECGVENPCCDRRGEYNGFSSGPLLFTCPKNCSCHD